MSGKRVLLAVADGPESIEIYTDDERGVIDWAQTFPPVYLTASVDGATVHLGPFTLPSIYKQLRATLEREIGAGEAFDKPA